MEKVALRMECWSKAIGCRRKLGPVARRVNLQVKQGDCYFMIEKFILTIQDSVCVLLVKKVVRISQKSNLAVSYVSHGKIQRMHIRRSNHILYIQMSVIVSMSKVQMCLDVIPDPKR